MRWAHIPIVLTFEIVQYTPHWFQQENQRLSYIPSVYELFYGVRDEKFKFANGLIGYPHFGGKPIHMAP